MAALYDSASYTAGEGDSNITWAHNTGNYGNRMMLIFVHQGALGNITTVTYNGVSASSLIARIGDADNTVATYSLASPAVGNNSVNVVTDAGWVGGSAITFYNVNLGNPFLDTDSATGTDTGSTLTLDSILGGAVADAVATAIAIAHTAGAGQTRTVENAAALPCAQSYEIPASTSTVMSWTWVNDQYAHEAVSLRGAAAGSQIIFIMFKQYQDLYWRLRSGLPLPEWYLRRRRPAWLASLKYAWATA